MDVQEFVNEYNDRFVIVGVDDKARFPGAIVSVARMSFESQHVEFITYIDITAYGTLLYEAHRKQGVKIGKQTHTIPIRAIMALDSSSFNTFVTSTWSQLASRAKVNISDSQKYKRG